MADDGYKVSGEFIRQLREVNKWVRGMSPGLLGLTHPPRARGLPTNWLPGYNSENAAIPAWGCVVIGTGQTFDSVYHAALRKPSTTFSRDIGFVGPDGALASASTTESVAARCGYHVEAGLAAYDSGTPAVGEMWGPKPGQYTLSKNFPGVTCLGIADSTNKIMWIRGEPITTMIGKTTGAITANSSTQAYTIQSGAAGSEADSGYTSPSGVPSARSRVAIATTKFVGLTWVNGHWEMQPLVC